jgi:hypothetical protein
MSKKQKFLLEHNRLSSIDLHVTMAMLSRFKTEKPSLFKDNEWSIDKLRRPFVFWLTSFSPEERKDMG